MSESLKRHFQGLTDVQLLHAARDVEGYEPQALELARLELEDRGGAEAIEANLAAEAARKKRLAEVASVVGIEVATGKEPDEVARLFDDPLLDAKDIAELAVRKREQIEEQKRVNSDTPTSVLRALLGGVVGGLIGGPVVSLFLIGRDVFFYFVGMVLLIICFGTPYLFSGRRKTIFVFLVGFGSLVLAAYFGKWLFAHDILAGHSVAVSHRR